MYVGTDPWEGQGRLSLQPHRGRLVGATVGRNEMQMSLIRIPETWLHPLVPQVLIQPGPDLD